jgi:hypothetical protein
LIPVLDDRQLAGAQYGPFCGNPDVVQERQRGRERLPSRLPRALPTTTIGFVAWWVPPRIDRLVGPHVEVAVLRQRTVVTGQAVVQAQQHRPDVRLPSDLGGRHPRGEGLGRTRLARLWQWPNGMPFSRSRRPGYGFSTPPIHASWASASSSAASVSSEADGSIGV